VNKKENFIAAVFGKRHEWVPNYMTEVAVCGGVLETFENGPAGGGLDGFGVEWLPSVSAAGAAVPHTVHPVLQDITKWREVVKFPNLDDFDWEGLAAKQLGGIDRNETPVEYQSWNAQFLRLTHLMGFENALCAMYEEPEECYALMDAVTDYKIGIVQKAAQYFKPDFFTSFDDVATERGLFMSPAIYRTLIKPLHKKLNDAIRGHGIHPMIHTCGRCEDIIGDYIDEGAVAWTSAQPMNDIAAIQKKYGRRIAIAGGYDANGRPGRSDTPEEEVRAEVRRCIDTYGPGGNFLLMGFRLVNSMDPKLYAEALYPINDECEKYGRKFREKYNA
jgi:hypothetical protein